MVKIGSGSSEISIQAVKSFIDTRECYFLLTGQHFSATMKSELKGIINVESDSLKARYLSQER